jgi:hypothetical protein
VLVIVFCLLALSLLVFTSVSNDKHFTAISPCDDLQDKGTGAAIIYSLIFIPYVGVVLVVLLMMASYATAGDDFKTKALSAAFSVSAPFILLFISMLVAVRRSRRSLAEQVKIRNITTFRSKFWIYWFVLTTCFHRLVFLKRRQRPGIYSANVTRSCTFAGFFSCP